MIRHSTKLLSAPFTILVTLYCIILLLLLLLDWLVLLGKKCLQNLSRVVVYTINHRERFCVEVAERLR